MTPRQVDVAFVLEGVSGVRAVYALDDAKLDFAVVLDNVVALAAAHYALLRVLTHEECERVRLITPDMATAPGRGATLLALDAATREAARARVPPPEPRPRLDVGPQYILIVSDAATAALVRETFPAGFYHRATTNAQEGINLAKRGLPWSLLLIDARFAFGASGVLARLPMERARRAHVLVEGNELADARRRIGEPERILTRPLSYAQLWRAFVRASGRNPTSAEAPALEPVMRARTIARPPPGAPLRVLLVDVEGDFESALGHAFGGELELVAKKNVDEALEYAFSNPVSVMLCGETAALAPRSFIDGIAREDEAAGRRIIVVANARNAVHTRKVLASRWRRNRVIALPVAEASLRAAVLGSHPELALPAPLPDGAPNIARPAYRRIAALVVDDDASTAILFSAGLAIDDVDVALETTSLAAFEHVLTRPVDVLFVSAAFRSDGGEPFYRSLWRMKPELKARTVLITSADAAPPSARDTKLPRILERPATRARIAEIIAAYRRG